MKRIGIITYHRATNYGAVLQAFSFVNKLKCDFGDKAEVEIIDYSTRTATNDHIKAVLGAFYRHGFSAGKMELNKNHEFNRFSNSLPMSNEKFVSDSIARVSEYMNNKYDVIISGSDAVFSWNGKKFPIVYLLGDNGKYKKLSYAASAHRLFYKNEPKERISYCSSAFKSFDYIGIRDKETEKFVKYCSPDVNPYHNCDPSFLIDLEKIKSSCNLSKFSNFNKPIILVMTPNEKIGKALIDKYSKHYSIVSLFVKNKAISTHLGMLTPFEWATIFGKAQITVTEYFHATIFSLLNGTPVVSVDSTSLSSGYEGKIHDLMYDRLDLPDMYVNIDQIKDKGEAIVIRLVDDMLGFDQENRIYEKVMNERVFYTGFHDYINKALS